VDGRRPSSVNFLDDIDQDLARRDFTVNALAWDPVGKVFRDPFGGRDDLRQRVLRAVGDPAERFAEDGLRPLRAVRFAAQLGFVLDGPTAAAIPAALPITGRVSVERITDELSRLLLAPHSRRGLDLLDSTGLLGVVLPDLAAIPASQREHAFDVAERVERDLTLRLAALLHVLAARAAPSAASIRVRVILDAIRVAGPVRDAVVALVAQHGCLLATGRLAPPRTDAEVRRWLSKVGPLRAPTILALWGADASSLEPASRRQRERAALRELASRLRRVEQARPPLAPSDLALDGRAVMEILRVPAGPAIGEALRHLLDRVLEDPRLNTKRGLTSELEKWWALRPSPG
jgi:tRNA nucleotidyltransferase (CCA-adding enzyme)